MPERRIVPRAEGPGVLRVEYWTGGYGDCLIEWHLYGEGVTKTLADLGPDVLAWMRGESLS